MTTITRASNIIEIALLYASQGLKVFPCKKDKSPLTLHGFKDASSDPETVKQIFSRSGADLIGLPTGRVNGVVVIDIDVNKNGDIRTADEILEALREYGDTPDTIQVQTPSGGRHLYFLTPETNLSSHTRFFDKTLPVDVKSNNGYVIAPDGKNYILYDDVDNLGVENFINNIAPQKKEVENE